MTSNERHPPRLIAAGNFFLLPARPSARRFLPARMIAPPLPRSNQIHDNPAYRVVRVQDGYDLRVSAIKKLKSGHAWAILLAYVPCANCGSHLARFARFFGDDEPRIICAVSASATGRGTTQKIISKIRKLIIRKGRKAVFASADFSDLGSRASVNRALSRLAKQGMIRRLTRMTSAHPMSDSTLALNDSNRLNFPDTLHRTTCPFCFRDRHRRALAAQAAQMILQRPMFAIPKRPARFYAAQAILSKSERLIPAPGRRAPVRWSANERR